MIIPKKIKDDLLTNRKFGNLLVLKREDDDNNSHHQWLCLCDCGNTVIVRGYGLTTGNTTSCDCKRVTNRTNHGNYKGYGEIHGKKWSNIKRGCNRNRVLEFNITIEFAWELFLKQNRKCALSGVDIWFAKTTKESESGGTSASLDRIDSNKGYTEDNVQWVHKDVNYMKQDLEQDYFIDMCEKIYKNKKGECHSL